MGGGGNVDRESFGCFRRGPETLQELILDAAATLSKGTTVSLATSIASYFVLSIPLFELAGLKIIGIGGGSEVSGVVGC